MSAVAEVPQHMKALAGANRIRCGRAKLKREVRAGTASLREVVADPPDIAAKVTTLEAVMWAPRVGPTRSRLLLRLADVSATRKLGNLTERERTSLVEQLRLSGVK